MEQILVSELSSSEIQAMTQQNLINKLTDAVQKYMDDTARSRNYDNILSACTYATSLHPPFQNEGQACVEWRDNVWMFCYQVLNEVLTGQRSIPTESELISLLPPINW